MKFGITCKFAVGIIKAASCFLSYLKISTKRLESGSSLREGMQAVAALLGN